MQRPMTGPVLALDLGTVTGWAIDGINGGPYSGIHSFHNTSRYDGGGMRFLRFRDWLDELLAKRVPTAVYFEEVRKHRGVDAAHIYGGMLAVLTAACEDRGIPYLGVPVGTIKRHATGKGNAPKEAMVAAMQARGFHPTDHNEADALAILLWAADTRGGTR